MRSFNDEITPAEDTQEAIGFYHRQAEKYWQQHPIYQQGWLALALQRSGKVETAGKIVRSLLDRALTSVEKGRYRAQNRQGYLDRRSVVSGRGVSVRVDLGGGQHLNKTKYRQ